MALSPRLEKELQLINGAYANEIVEEPELINIVFRNFDLGDGFSVPKCDLLIRVPRSYPDAGPDMFWTNPEVTLANGQPPQAAEHLEAHMGRNWRRFSWHRKSWNPTIDNLTAVIEFIRRRLREKK